MADAGLIDACFMWCKAKGLKPIPTDGEQETLTRLGIGDYKGDFAGLNRAQRRLIAGLAKD